MLEQLQNNWPILAFMIGQTIGVVRWAFSVNVSVDVIKNDIVGIKKAVDEAYPLRDGLRLEKDVDELERFILNSSRQGNPHHDKPPS